MNFTHTHTYRTKPKTKIRNTSVAAEDSLRLSIFSHLEKISNCQSLNPLCILHWGHPMNVVKPHTLSFACDLTKVTLPLFNHLQMKVWSQMGPRAHRSRISIRGQQESQLPLPVPCAWTQILFAAIFSWSCLSKEEEQSIPISHLLTFPFLT